MARFLGLYAYDECTYYLPSGSITHLPQVSPLMHACPKRITFTLGKLLGTCRP